MIRYIQLNKFFDPVLLRQDVDRLLQFDWRSHYNTAHYSGSWTVLPLRSMHGDASNPIAVHAAALQENDFRDTPLMDQCTYIPQILSFFQCELTMVRLMKLDAGAVIKEHRDTDMSFEEGECRLHIPVITHPAVEFYIEEEKIPMKEGECWYLNLSLPHRVVNPGPVDRIHLVIDCMVNDWVKELFSQDHPVRKDMEDDGMKSKQSAEQTLLVIAELRRQDTETSRALADQLEAGLK